MFNVTFVHLRYSTLSNGPHDTVLGTELGAYCKNGRPSELPSRLSHSLTP